MPQRVTEGVRGRSPGGVRGRAPIALFVAKAELTLRGTGHLISPFGTASPQGEANRDGGDGRVRRE